MRLLKQFVDYAFYNLHRKNEIEKLYNVVDIEVLFGAWHSMKYDYGITDKKILGIIENDINDFVFKMDFYNFFISANDIHDYLIVKYQYDTRWFEKKRKKELNKINKRLKLFDWVIGFLGQ